MTRPVGSSWLTWAGVFGTGAYPFSGERPDAPRTYRCQWCGRHDTDGIGNYYHEADCGRRKLSDQLEVTTDPKQRKFLEDMIERVSYVGD